MGVAHLRALDSALRAVMRAAVYAGVGRVLRAGRANLPRVHRLAIPEAWVTHLEIEGLCAAGAPGNATTESRGEHQQNAMFHVKPLGFPIRPTDPQDGRE